MRLTAGVRRRRRRGKPGAAGRVAGEEAGFTLVELLLVTSLLTVVLGAILALFDVTAKLAPRDEERAHVIREAQVGLHRMTRELRHADTVTTYTSTSLAVTIPELGAGTTVNYNCAAPHPTESTYRRCVRWLSGSTTTAQEVIIDRVSNGTSPVFEYEPSGPTAPTYVSTRIVTPARGDRREGHVHDVVLEDGVELRNVDGG